MSQLWNYIISKFPTELETSFARDMLDNILEESEKIENIAERCDWLAKMIPQISSTEIRDILLR
ncbi:hypothetical protein [Lacrimispora celerecrescens]|uniref:Uncharacterized protein n=1 Tax=[Clostridium] celerecrescens 18A TaxID=1286362 RepID=A0A2M8YZU4_9FIRM|nr:hypothetical protein [Lacrimispora celerecrescens]PJJ26707.1 hypothetical protein H171_0147 [[Clostridium] celerecrescens 18A]